MCHARHSLDSEDGLRLGTEGDGGSSLSRQQSSCAPFPRGQHQPFLFSRAGYSQGFLLKGVRNAIFLQQRKKIGRVLIDDDVFARNVNPESIWGKVFAVLCPELVFARQRGPPELVTYPPQQGIEQHRNILLCRVGKVDLDDIGHLVSIAVDKVGLERA
jgi:hypothetical protein